MKALWIVLGVTAAVVLLVVLRRPLGKLGRLCVRSGLWLGFLWLLRGLTPLLGISLGVNLFNAAVLGVLGVPGLALLMIAQLVLR